MADYYADSSALIKRHINETGSTWFQTLAAPETDNAIITARISVVEVYSAFNRRLREADLALEDYQDLAADFEVAYTTEYELVELTPQVADKARQLLENHLLRAYDAVQLASALLANNTLLAANLPPLAFLAADNRLLAAAQAEGLPVDNPNNHP